MVTIDRTKEAVTITGNHVFLSYALKEAEKGHIALYGEIASFDPGKEYPQLKPNVAYFFAFARRIFRSEVNIILLASSLVEAMANMFYSERADRDTFSILERTKIIEKWVTLPKLYVPTYSLPKEGKIYKTLKELNTRRNSITHPKPHMIKGNNVLHKGNLYKRTSDEYKLHLEFCKLPCLLIEHLKKHDSSAGTDLEMMFSMLSEIEHFK